MSEENKTFKVGQQVFVVGLAVKPNEKNNFYEVVRVKIVGISSETETVFVERLANHEGAPWQLSFSRTYERLSEAEEMLTTIDELLARGAQVGAY